MVWRGNVLNCLLSSTNLKKIFSLRATEQCAEKQDYVCISKSPKMELTSRTENIWAALRIPNGKHSIVFLNRLLRAFAFSENKLLYLVFLISRYLYNVPLSLGPRWYKTSENAIQGKLKHHQ